MKTKLIVMLTKNDRTVADAMQVFESAYDLPVEYWGFKNVGLPKLEMGKLVERMKAAGKKVFLEVVTYSPEACLEGAMLAVEMRFDYLCGTIYYPEVWAYLSDKPIKFLPFVGEVSGSPSVLNGSIEAIIEQSLALLQKGVGGVDLLAYRHTGNPETLIREFAKRYPGTIVVAGSIDTPERMRFVEDNNVWAFTMGSALFNRKFDPDNGFRANLAKVVAIMDSIN